MAHRNRFFEEDVGGKEALINNMIIEWRTKRCHMTELLLLLSFLRSAFSKCVFS